jgi:Flp pilus assembly protein TadG
MGETMSDPFANASAPPRRARRAAMALLRRRMRRFGRDEDGALAIFGLFMLVLMLVAGGMAVDFMRFEADRTRLQNTSDTATLAAASLTQVREPRDVVDSYFNAAGLGDQIDDVQVDEGINFRNVQVAASGQMSTFFLRMVGLNSLTVPGRSGAEERIPNVEVSLVLDISGSMRFGDVPQIGYLRTAGRNFAERMLAGDRDELVSISIVPYAGGVNPGKRVFDLLGGRTDETHAHSFSYCMELGAGDFTHTGLPSAGSYSQIAHFMHWPIDWNFMQWGWCPYEGDAAGGFGATIQYFRGDANEVGDFIDNVPLHDGTGTHFGVRWGLALLDPASRWLTQELAMDGTVPERFRNRPADWDDPETLKVMVLMTDGAITDQFRPRVAPNMVDRTVSGVVQKVDANGYRELLEQRTTSTRRAFYGCDDYSDNNCHRTLTNVSTNRNRFYAACNLAKQNGVVIYTIAFNTTSSAAATEMRNCASSPAHYFNVLNEELDEAFQAIAGSIQMLRLTE